MIRLLVRLPIALLMVLTIVWAAVLGISRDPLSILRGGLERLASAYPGTRVREEFLAEWWNLPDGWSRPLAPLGGQARCLGWAGLLVTRLHAGVLLRLLPVFLSMLLAGVALGLVWRERMRKGEGYASPTAAGISRVLVGAGLFWMALFGASPIPVSYAWLPLAGMACGAGASLYAANLPLKL